MRLTPEVRFLNDESFVRGERVLRLLERADLERGTPASSTSDNMNDEYEDDDDDDDEGFLVFDEDDDEDDEEDVDAADEAAARSKSASDSSEASDSGRTTDSTEVIVEATTAKGKPKAKVNRFLVGLDDDSDEDDEGVERKFFTTEMFPDAQPELENLNFQKKAMQWAEKQGKFGAKGQSKARSRTR